MSAGALVGPKNIFFVSTGTQNICFQCDVKTPKYISWSTIPMYTLEIGP